MCRSAAGGEAGTATAAEPRHPRASGARYLDRLRTPARTPGPGPALRTTRLTVGGGRTAAAGAGRISAQVADHTTKSSGSIEFGSVPSAAPESEVLDEDPVGDAEDGEHDQGRDERSPSEHLVGHGARSPSPAPVRHGGPQQDRPDDRA